MHNHDQRWDRNWRRMEAMARRGFRQFGSGPGRGDWGGFGDNVRIGRMLASGDLRLVMLYLIEQQPRHGYDLIKAVEEKSQGIYSPSPGIVYPALTFIEEAGYVTSSTDGNKKLYTITDEGRAHLADNREAIESTLSFLGKAGAQVKDWRDKLSSPDFPFSPEQAEKFRDMGRQGWPFGRGDEPPQEAGHRHPDRDIRDVPPEVNEARKALKKAIKEAIGKGEAEQRRVAAILHRAAEEIRQADDDIDL